MGVPAPRYTLLGGFRLLGVGGLLWAGCANCVPAPLLLVLAPVSRGFLLTLLTLLTLTLTLTLTQAHSTFL